MMTEDEIINLLHFPCANAKVIYCRTELTLREWLHKGPFLHLTYPVEYMFCDEGGSSRSQLLPLQYRNNELLFFLTALGVIDYPWRHLVKGGVKPKRVSIGKMISSNTLPPIQISKHTTEAQLKFIGNEIYSDITMQLPSQLFNRLYTFLGITAPIITNNLTIHRKLEHEDNSILQDGITMSVVGHALLFPTLERYAQRYMPDPIFTRKVVSGSISHQHYPSVSYSAEVRELNLFLLVIVIRLPRRKTSMIEGVYSVLRIFAMSSLERAEKMQTLIHNLINSAAISID